MKYDLKGNTLIITVELGSGTRSTSGKSLVLASTNGNVQVGEHNGKPLILGLNVYQPIREGK